MKSIIEQLLEQTDVTYKKFQGSLIPTIEADKVLGIRTPVLRSFAKKYAKNSKMDEQTEQAREQFLRDLPHQYFEENQIHAFIIETIKDYDECIEELERFLPYVDNWATCDQMTPKVFKKNKEKLLLKISEWIASEETYTIRFAIKMLMSFYLDEDFDEKYLKMVAAVKSEEYYVNMMIAWYFATALAKQYDSTIPYIENRVLPEWVHKKTIQKARESFRVSKEQKEYLKSLK